MKKHNTPAKHKGKVHPVGHYKGHLSQARKFWNKLPNKIPANQMTRDLAYQMSKPEPMTSKEIAKAEDAGLNVQGLYVVSKMG